MPERPLCLLSVDLEEWTYARLAGVDVAARGAGGRDLDDSVDRLLELLDEAGARATFFTLGRVARRHPALVRRIALRHELASHGNDHTDLRDLDARRLARDLRRSRAVLQDLTGQPVEGYRAPNFSLGACLPWALPVLRDEGLRFDSSLLPGRGFLFLPGGHDVPRRPHLLDAGGLWEFPPTVVRLPGLSLPAAGGAFLRTLPQAWVIRVLERAVRRSETPHVHLHPWDVAPPMTGPGRLRSAILFGGSGSVRAKLHAILERYRGTAIEDLRRALPARRPDTEPLLRAPRPAPARGVV